MNITMHVSTPQETMAEVLTILENMRRSYNSSGARAIKVRDRNDAHSSANSIAAAINLLREVRIVAKDHGPTDPWQTSGPKEAK